MVLLSQSESKDIDAMFIDFDLFVLFFLAPDHP